MVLQLTKKHSLSLNPQAGKLMITQEILGRTF